MINVTFIFLFFVSFNLFAQNYITKFPNQDSTRGYSNSVILGDSQNNLLMFYHEADSLFFSNSYDDGNTWMGKHFITQKDIEEGPFPFDGISTKDGKMMLLVNNLLYYSSDDGDSWEVKHDFKSLGFDDAELCFINDSTYWVIWSRFSTFFYTIDTGNTWQRSSFRFYPDYLVQPSATSINDSTVLIVSANYKSGNGHSRIVGWFTDNTGKKLGERFIIVDSELNDYDPKIVRYKNNYAIVYSTSIEHIANSNPVALKYITSLDGLGWTDPMELTSYLGQNLQHSMNKINDDTWITFQSHRFNRDQIWYTKFEDVVDQITPPYIQELIEPYDEYLRDKIKVGIHIWDENLNSLDVNFDYFINNNPKDYLNMEYVNEEPTNPNIRFYETEIMDIKASDTLIYRLVVTDNEGFTVNSKMDTIIFKDGLYEKQYLIDVNHFSLPIDNKGKLGNVMIVHPDRGLEDGGRYRGKNVLYHGGFGLSGYNSYGKLWSNGVISLSRIEDYIPGTIDSLHSNDSLIYVLQKTDSAFGGSWQKWKDAVKLGANYYDGDQDEKYNPIDKNGNGIWDPNEDRPDLLGDITAWSVYNDGTPSNLRRYSNVSPQGIEIRQTLWAYDKIGALGNTIFIRYSILNTGIHSDSHDSVLFSIWTDPDIGLENWAWRDDLVGCDTTLNMGFVYNDGYDNEFGLDPPILITKYLQGPIVASSDSESMAFNRKGILGEEVIKGSENIGMSSFLGWKKTLGIDVPNGPLELRYYMQGKNLRGEYVDPCTWVFGKVHNMQCSVVDSKFMYSGNPLQNHGWIFDNPTDVKMFANTGPFKLEEGKPVDIIVAYIVGDGKSALNSVTVGKEYAKQIQSFYESNFTKYVVGGIEENETTIPSELSLSQNYPNPFNPTTVIEYSIPRDVKRQTGNVKGTFIPSGVEGERVQLIVYDILGREVATLVNENQKPGNYKVSFPRHSSEGRNLSSGVYFYRLTHRDNIITKKMILLK